MRISDWSSDVCSSDLCEHPLPESERAKIALFCNVRKEAVIPALDAPSIYAVPLQYHREGLDREVLRAFGIADAPAPDMAQWSDIMDRYANPRSEEHTSELQSLMRISYAVFCLKKKDMTIRLTSTIRIKSPTIL